MLLKILLSEENIHYYTVDKTFFRTRSEDGLMTLQFDISPYHPQYSLFELDTQVEFDGQLYLVSSINERKNTTTISCKLDLTGLKSTVFRSFAWDKVSFSVVAQEAIENTGWSILGAETIKKKSTTRIEYCNPYDLFNYFRNKTSYNASYKFNTKTKTIQVIHPYDITAASGVYFSDELNIKELTYKGDSSNIVTRLMPLGKDDMNISSVNNGSWYIENHSFSDKVITEVWKDDRYTDPESLLADARLKLEEKAKPEQSYVVNIIDLAKSRPDIYKDVLNYDLYDIITIIDRRRRRRIEHRIVEIREYPADPTLNTIILSTKPNKVKRYK